MPPTKNNKKTISDDVAERIEEEMVFGYNDEDGTKQYPTLKSSAEWYEVSYDYLRQLAKTWKWRQRRKDHQYKVSQKIKEKKKSEEISDAEAEDIIVDDYRFNKAANKLRRAVVRELEKIENGEIYLYSDNEGNKVFGTPKNTTYLLMNAGKALESAQKVSKLAAGEPSEIGKTTSNVKVEGIENSILNPKMMDAELEYAKKLIKSKEPE